MFSTQTRLTIAGLVAWGLVSIGTAAAQNAPAAKDEKGKAPAAKVGEAAPEFALLDYAGKKVSLSQYKDKVVVLEWISPECPWSRKVAPLTEALYKKYAAHGVVWLGIDSTNWRKPEEVAKYVQEAKTPYPILLDNDGRVGRAYGAKTTPHVFVIARGKLVYSGALHNDQQGQKKPEDVRQYLDEALAAVLADKPVPLAETTPWGCGVKYKK